jgi:hypothetical protein
MSGSSQPLTSPQQAQTGCDSLHSFPQLLQLDIVPPWVGIRLGFLVRLRNLRERDLLFFNREVAGVWRSGTFNREYSGTILTCGTRSSRPLVSGLRFDSRAADVLLILLFG